MSLRKLWFDRAQYHMSTLSTQGSILQAAKNFAPQVKRIVITSSFAAMQLNIAKDEWPEHTYFEVDWNPITWEEAIGTGPLNTYRASKTFAERAAWNFLEKEKANFTVTTINPAIVWGPIIHDVTPKTLNTSNEFIWNLVNGSQVTLPPIPNVPWVDVRNVAEAHVTVLETPKAENQRYFVVAGNDAYNEISNIVLKNFPDLSGKVPTEGDVSTKTTYNEANSKSKKDLGIEYISLEQSIVDLTKQLVPWLSVN
ncbi:hypothetical protein V1517DRAFT_326126 [Lipomyces orientalis]|uniref:Uncharacterized protein n=1 Tax=Lipomyces orientalis TaxID=1233043 RepID=A0ACC3TK56_9ASCO